MNITIEDHNVKATMFEANQLIWRLFSKKLRLISLVFFVLGIVSYSYLHYAIKDVEMDLSVLVFCWIVALLVFTRLLRTKRSFWTNFEKVSSLAFSSNTRKIIITDEGIEGITDYYRSFAKWNIVTTFKVYDKYISITHLMMPTPFFVPINLMNDEEYKSLLYYLRTNKKESK